MKSVALALCTNEKATMATPSGGRDIEQIWRLVEEVAKDASRSVTEQEEESLRYLRNLLGTRRPVESYAPRTRRRYRAATRRNETARVVNQREYAQRRARAGLEPSGRRESQRSQVRRLIEERNRYLPAELVDVEDVDDYVRAFGYRNVIRLLQDQIDSCQHYLQGDRRPGNTRWNERRWTRPEDIKPSFSDYISNTDIMYYYHARRG